MKTVVQPYDEEVDVTVLEVDMPEPELLEQKSGSPEVTPEDWEKVKPIYTDFMQSYTSHPEQPVEQWLGGKLQEYLPEEPSEEIHKMTDEIVTTLHRNEAMHQSLQEAVANGRSKESWFAAQTQKSVSAMSTQEASVYLAELDKALDTANEQLYHTINTKAGVPSQNPNLDGYIAEQYHAQTFNLNAEAAGSEYRAKVLEPDGAYGKNSVDVVIVDGEGKIVKRYQCKYGQDSHATGEMFEKGDYRGQGKLIPDGQEIEKKSSNVIEAPDGTTSKPLSKEKAKQMQEEAQSGNWSELNWNEYQVKDLAMGIGKQAGAAALQGAVIGAGMTVAQKVWNGEEIDGQEVVEAALTGGADFGVKAATAGALKVASEKEILSVIPKGTPAGTFANIAYVAVENVKVLGKVATGELTLREGFEKIQDLCRMNDGKPAAAYIFAVLVENVRLLFPQALGIHTLAFGGYPQHLITRCCAIGGILHLQLDLLLDGRFLLFHLLDLVRKLLPLIQKSMQSTQVSGLVPVVYLIKLVDLLGVTIATVRCRGNLGHNMVRPEKLFLINKIRKHLLIRHDFVDHQLSAENQSRHIPAVETADG